MGQIIMAISYFQYHRVQENGINVYHFHFMGPYRGAYLKKIAATSSQILTFRPKTIYLLHLEYRELQGNTLWAQLLQHKEIDDCQQI